MAAEAAFLAMDLDYNGYADHARAFVDAYVRHSGDGEVLRLLDFYRCYYATVRGKVISFRVDDPHIGCADRDAAVRTAARYFDLALSYAARPANRTLILVAGLMGTGKSVLARALAPRSARRSSRRMQSVRRCSGFPPPSTTMRSSARGSIHPILRGGHTKRPSRSHWTN